ncbi:MAG: LCP family protein [Clostridia bacterium]|nr:LCP family protein [Clostridia bacterium]
MADGSDRPTRRSASADTDDIPNINGIRERRNNSERVYRADSYNRANSRTTRGSAPITKQNGRRTVSATSQRTAPDSRTAAAQRTVPAQRAAAAPKTGRQRKKNKKKEKYSVGYKVACAIVIILIVLTLALTGLGIAYFKTVNYQVVEIDRNNDSQEPSDAASTETTYIEDGAEVRTIVPVHEGDERYNLYDAIKDWKKQGNSNYYLQSTKVINILLAGIDRNEDGSDGRSDSMMLASINLNTKQVVLSSIFRDCWFWATFDEGERTIWCKINESFVYGGPSGLISNIEDYFKIHIDHFVGVDFQSFRDIIDGIGGIEVAVTDREAKYINEQTGYTANPAVEGEHVHLDGFQALWYVRMRHVDAEEEVGRTRRQRQFVTAMIDKFKGTSATEMGNLVNTFMSYIQTDMTKSEILTYGTRAILGQWYNYEIVQQQVPDDDYRIDAYRQGYFDNKWVWVCDFPGAAYEMQKRIYGYSNVILNENRRTAMDIWERN